MPTLSKTIQITRVNTDPRLSGSRGCQRYYAARYYVTRTNHGRSSPTDRSELIPAEEKHGYAMVEDIATFAGVRLGPGTLYGAITRLEKQGWIKPVSSTDRRQPYRLTATGKRHLEAELAALQQVVKTGVSRLKPA